MSLGTEEERGMLKWRAHIRGEGQQQYHHDDSGRLTSSTSCYDLPCGMSFVRRSMFCKYIPFCPTFLANTNNNIVVNGGSNDNEPADMSSVNMDTHM